jgi:hypothetical protein
VNNVKRIEAHADNLEMYVGISRAEWFTGEYTSDSEMPGGSYTRTRARNGACVFLNRTGRGCLIHQFCLDNGQDYHELKPMVSCLFPVTFGEGVLLLSNEVKDGSVICMGHGPSVYRGVRSEIEYYFGRELVSELDELEAEILHEARPC